MAAAAVAAGRAFTDGSGLEVVDRRGEGEGGVAVSTPCCCCGHRESAEEDRDSSVARVCARQTTAVAVLVDRRGGESSPMFG